MKKKTILLFALLLFSTVTIPFAEGQLNPIAVSGWIYLEDASPASNANVTVINVNTGSYANTTTNVNGQYVATLSGSDGDIIRVICSHLGEAGVNNTTVDLSDPTQWRNLSLSPSAIPPDALFSYSQYNVEGMVMPFGQSVFFHDYSTDVDGSVVGWHWNFGDSHTSVGKTPHHAYDKDGTYRVTLTVTDNDGLTDEMGKNVKIETGAREENVSIPKPMPPLYPGFTVPEMYDLLRVSDLPNSDSKVVVVFVDSGVYPRTYDGIDLASIESYYHPSYTSGIDENGHGSFVSYELAYIMQTKLPNAVLISYKIFGKNGECSPEIFLEALDDIKRLNPDVVSISAGAFGNPSDAFSKKVKELRNSGIIVFCASGNLGPTPSTILSPACSDSAIAIAASNPRWSDDYEERQRIILDLSDDTICPWSSRGPVLDLFKPDVTGPGESIRSVWKQGERVASGTSFSAPLIAGGSCVVLSEHKLLVDILRAEYFWYKGLVPDIFESALKDGCYQKGDKDTWGAGIPQFDKVLDSFFWGCIFWILLLPVIIVIIAVSSFFIYRFYKKKKPRKEKPAPVRKSTKIGSKYL